MAQTKYMIFKAEDAVKHLNDEQKAHLTEIFSAIAAGRRRENKSLGDLFFVLNMKDQFAVQALDAYIAAIQEDGRYTTTQGVADALTVATDVRHVAALKVTPKLPD